MTDEAAVAEEPVDLLPDGEGEGTPEAEGITVDDQGNRFDADGNALPPEEETTAERPEWLPEKFKTPEALAESYKQLERKLHEKQGIPDEYAITYGEEPVELEEEDVAFFKEVGLSNEQAQKIYTQLIETVGPELQKARTETELARLGSEWNMDTQSVQFQERMAKLAGWAKKNMPEEAVAHLRSSAKGIQALWTMMQAGAQAGAPPGGSTTPRKSLAELNDMVKDPRYATDEGYRQQVEKEFSRVFDGG